MKRLLAKALRPMVRYRLNRPSVHVPVQCLLSAPLQFINATAEYLKANTNACGPDGVLNAFVPDFLFWISIAAACNIHDICYLCGLTEEDRLASDKTLHNNIIRIVKARTKWYDPLRLVAQVDADLYYEAVRTEGDTFYWDGKIKPSPLPTGETLVFQMTTVVI